MIGTLRTVHCDAARTPLCQQWIGNEDTAEEARRLARARGWIRRWKQDGDQHGGRYHSQVTKIDVCPECQKVSGADPS